MGGWPVKWVGGAVRVGGWTWLILNPTMPCIIIQLQYECLSSAMLCV